MHYGLLPRANRGIFAINELPDLAGKIQVGLFNILQEGDVQIKGYPIRLKLDVMLVFTANPEDYTARGKIITPLKDRIGSEIRTHYPATRQQRDGDHEAGSVDRSDRRRCKSRFRTTSAKSSRRSRSRRAPIARSTSGRASASGCRSRRSSSSSRTPSAARSRTARSVVVPRVTDVYAALPSITGKFELEYEGELRGAEQVARDLIRSAVGIGLHRHVRRRRHAHGRRMVRPRRLAAARATARRPTKSSRRRAACRASASWPSAPGSPPGAPAPAVASAIDFVLEGLYAQKKISRSDERGYSAGANRRRAAPTRREEPTMDEEIRMPSGKKKYYN